AASASRPAGTEAAPAAAQATKPREAARPAAAQEAKPKEQAALAAAGPAGTVPVKVPDIGDFKDVPVIEVFVKPGDAVKPEDPLVTLESDKATMDVPAPSAGTVKELKVKVGDKVSEGSVILTLETGAAAAASAPSARKEAPAAAGAKTEAPTAGPSAAPSPAAAAAPEPVPTAKPAAPVDDEAFRGAHASPSVRAFARTLGVDLSKVKGSGPKARILQEDVQNYVKQAIGGVPAGPGAAAAGGAALGLLPWPQVDFAKFGPVESKPLSRIKKISGANLHRNWVMIPHVTNHEDADITDLEAFRVKLNKEIDKSGVRVSMLSFMIKASVASLKKFPEFNASLD